MVCINDGYNLKYTINNDEPDRRSKNPKNIPNILIKSADKFPSSTQFTSILSNSSNKVRLQELIEMRLKEYSSTNVKEIIQCTGLSAKNMCTVVNIDEFGLNHVTQKVSGELLTKEKNIYADSRTLFTTAMVHVIV